MKINAFLWWSWNGSLSHFCKRQRLQKSLNQLSPLTSHLVHWSFKRLTWYFLDKMFYNPLHVCVDWPNPTLSLHGIRDQRGGWPRKRGVEIHVTKMREKRERFMVNVPFPVLPAESPKRASRHLLHRWRPKWTLYHVFPASHFTAKGTGKNTISVFLGGGFPGSLFGSRHVGREELWVCKNIRN